MTLGTILGSELEGLEYQHPFCNRPGEVFPADFVTADTGTGFVHIAPGHGQDDYNLGRLAGLPIYSPVDDDGKFAYTNDFPIEQQMPLNLSANPFWKNTARATQTKLFCTSCAFAMRCCIRKIIITAIRIAGAARRRSFSARWTSGLSD